MSYNIVQVNGGYKVASQYRGITKYYSMNPISYENAKRQYLILEKSYKYNGGSNSATNTGNNTINNAEGIIGDIPEASQVLDGVNTLADFILKFVPDGRTVSTQFREQYVPGGEITPDAYEEIVDKYGIDSDPAELFRQYYPNVISDNEILYNIPEDLSSGFRYPANIQSLYTQAQNLPISNYKNAFASIAKKLGVDTSDSSFQQTFRNIHFDHISLATTGHY